MADKKYTVQEFVEKYKKASDVDKSKLIKEIGVKTYIPYAQKVVHSEAVLSQSAKRINGVLQSQSAKRFLVFTTSVLKLYTELSLNTQSPHEDYDILRECGVLDVITARIGEDLEEFKTVFNMVWDDMVYNENNWKTFVSGQIVEVLKSVVEAIGDSEDLNKQILKFNSALKM